MSKPITLLTATGTPFANATVDSNFPLLPSLVLWRGRIFRANGVSYGPQAPGAYDPYIEVVDMQTIAENGVVALNVAPTDAGLHGPNRD